MYGFLTAAHKTVKETKDQGTREVLELMFLKGVRALTTEEIAEQSLKWLQETVLPTYIHHLKNKNEPASKSFLSDLYAADHVRCIL